MTTGAEDAGFALVTGGGGFLGRHVAAVLAARGARVRAFDLGFTPPLPEGVEAVVGDVRDRRALEPALEGCDRLYHLAALTDLWQPDSSLYEAVNVEGTRTVFEAAAAAGVPRAVHVSSYVTLIAGPRKPERIVSEDDPPPADRLIGPYARSKGRSEALALSFADRLEVVAVLPSAPIGSLDHRLTPPMRLIRDLLAGALPATLDCLVNFVGARAVADGIVAASDRGTSGRRYLLAGEDATMAEFLAAFREVSGKKAPRWHVPYALALATAAVEEGLVSRLTKRRPTAPLAGVRIAGRSIRFDASRARAELGFDPPPLDEALREAIAWLHRCDP